MAALDQALALKELSDVLEDLVKLLKNGDVGSALSARGINTSLAMVAAEGLAAYLAGDKARAAEDLGTVAEEIAARLATARGEGGDEGQDEADGSNGGPS